MLIIEFNPTKIPDNTKLQKDTVSALVKGSTVFINYLGMFPPVFSNS